MPACKSTVQERWRCHPCGLQMMQLASATLCLQQSLERTQHGTLALDRGWYRLGHLKASKSETRLCSKHYAGGQRCSRYRTQDVVTGMRHGLKSSGRMWWMFRQTPSGCMWCHGVSGNFWCGLTSDMNTRTSMSWRMEWTAHENQMSHFQVQHLNITLEECVYTLAIHSLCCQFDITT